MAWNPNIPTVTNRVQDDLDAIRENFQHLDQLAERVDELQTVSELAPIANDLQTVSGLAPVVEELQAVSALAPYVQALLDSRIVEMGSNSNGTYVRWENGLQVCWLPRLTLPTQSSSQAYANWTFPAAFVDTNYSVHITQTWQSGDAGAPKVTMAFTQNRAESRCSVRLASKNADLVDGDSWGVALVAIGRWK